MAKKGGILEVSEEVKLKELSSILYLFYQNGLRISHQSRLFKVKENKEDKELKKFSKLINEESKKRNIKPHEVIKYFAVHKEELIELYEKKSIKTLLPKFSKIYTHSEIENIMHNVLKTRKLKDIGINNIFDDSITGEVKIWEGKGVEYIVKVEDLLKLDDKNPKVYVTQAKSLLLLMGMIQEQQFNNDIKEPKCEFTLSYYAERRGYTKEEINKGGNFFNELKRDLFSGAYTTYRIKQMMIEGKEYTIHNTFYGLYEPKNHENKWKVEFNNPYGKWILEILNGEAEQYFIKDHKAIEDRITTNKPFLFLFYQQLIKRKRANLITLPVKIGSLLKDMKIDEQILARPKECFELLRECLVYFSEHYQPVPELESFYLYNDFHKTKTAKLPLLISEAFKEYGYIDFKDLLAAIGIKDIREAYISFKRPYKKPKEYKLNEEEEQLLKRTLNWFEDKITKIPREDQESMIKRYIKKYGLVEYERLFEREANKRNANAVEFLTKVLPDSDYRSIKERDD